MSHVTYYVPLKTSGTAYLWWLFLGAVGAHKFYLGRPGLGVLYMLTFGLFWVGLIWDLFTIPGQVRRANERLMSGGLKENASVGFGSVERFDAGSRDFARADELIAKAKQEMCHRPAAPAAKGFGRRNLN
jgi:TM2 domain-containing membrane protein YozV